MTNGGFEYAIAFDMQTQTLLKTLDTLERLEKHVNIANDNANKLRESLNSVGVRGRMAFDGIAGSLQSVVGWISMIDIGRRVLSLGSDAEQTGVAFRVMLQDVKVANNLLADLNTFANVTPFTNKEVIDAGRLLVGYGMSAKSIIPTLTTVGNVASGLNIPLKELTSIYGKLTIKPVVHTDDINMLSERGVPVIRELGRMLHVSSGKVLKMAEDGKISSAMMIQALGNMAGKGGQFAGMMAAQGETVGGKWSTFMGTMEMLGITIGTKLMPTALNLLNNYLIPGATWLSEHSDLAISIVSNFLALSGVVKVFSLAKAFGSVKDFVGMFEQVKWVIDGLNFGRIYMKMVGPVQAVQVLFRQLSMGIASAFAANPVFWIIVGLVALGAAIFVLWNKFAWFRGMVMGVWEVVSGLSERLYVGLVQPIWNGFVKIVGFLGELKNKFWDFVMGYAMPLFEKLGAALGGIFSKLIPDLPKDLYGLGYAKGEKSFYDDKLKDFAPKDAISSIFGSNGKTPMGGIGGGDKDGHDKLKRGVEAITGGGTRNTNIVIHKMGENITIQTTNLKQGAEEVQAILSRMLLQVINSANQTQAN
jgi:tape measure domain-containing protein